MKYVIDATVAVKWYQPEIYSEQAVALVQSDVELVVPDILYAQASNVFWKRVKANQLSIEEAHRCLRNLRRLPLRRVSTESLLNEALEIACLTTRTLNEALYFALAIREDTQVVTADRRWFGLVSTGPMRAYLAFVSDVIKTDA